MNPGSGYRIVAVSLLAALVVVGHGCSRDDATLSSEEARELYSLSRISPQLGVAREFLNAQIALRRDTWTAEQFEVATRLIDEQLSAKNLSRKILDRLEQQPEPKFTAAVLEWLRTPETIQVHTATATTTNAESTEDFMTFIAESRQTQPSAERLALIERYDRAARCSSDSSNSLRLAIYGAGVMSDALEPNGARSGTDALGESAERRSELLEPFFEELSAITLRFAFRGLSDADVAAFVEHSESEPAQWHYQTLSNVFLDTLDEISRNLGTAFLTALESQPDS